MLNVFHTQDGYVKNTNPQTATIAIRNDGFSFIICSHNSVAALCYVSISTNNFVEYEQALHSFLQHELLQQSFEKISVLYCSQSVSVVPQQFYSPETARKMLQLTQPCAEDERVETYPLQKLNAVVLYALPQHIVRICNAELHTNCTFYPHIAAFIERSFARYSAVDALYENMLNQAQNNSEYTPKTLYISLESYYFDLLVIRTGKLELYNSFAFNNVNDFVYAVLNVCKQLGLNPQTVNIVLSGKISENSNYCKALQMFASHAHVETVTNSAYEFPFNPTLYSVFSNLISVNVCE
jgi:hypothetical protein